MFQFTIIVAGVECLILSHDKELFRLLRKAYKPFLSDTKNHEFTFLFFRTPDNSGAVLHSCSMPHYRAELAIGDIQNANNSILFNYLFKIVFAKFYIAKQYGLLIHAASVTRHGKAIVIAGGKGAGKSTSLQLLRSSGFIGLSDDVALLNITDTSVCVHASPFQERHDFPKKNIHAIVTSLIFLHKTHKNNHMTELNMVQRVNAIYYHSYAWGFGQYADAVTMKTLRILAYKAASSVRCFNVYLHTIDTDALRFYLS